MANIIQTEPVFHVKLAHFLNQELLNALIAKLGLIQLQVPILALLAKLELIQIQVPILALNVKMGFILKKVIANVLNAL